MIPLLDLTAQYHELKSEIDAAVVRVLESSQFIAKKEGASGAHSDIAGPQVAHALWQAALVS